LAGRVLKKASICPRGTKQLGQRNLKKVNTRRLAHASVSNDPICSLPTMHGPHNIHPEAVSDLTASSRIEKMRRNKELEQRAFFAKPSFARG
jgi:hypothetical protein